MTREGPEPPGLPLPGQSGIKDRPSETEYRLTAPWCVTSPHGHSYDGRTTPRTAVDQARSTRWHGGAMVEGSMTQGAGLEATAGTMAAVPPVPAYGASTPPGPVPPAPAPAPLPDGYTPTERLPVVGPGHTIADTRLVP